MSQAQSLEPVDMLNHMGNQGELRLLMESSWSSADFKVRDYPELSELGPPEDAMQLTLKMQEEVKECNAKNATLTAGKGKEMDSTSVTSRLNTLTLAL